MTYDSIADRYDTFVRERSTIHRVAIPALLELCRPAGRVLDLACGQGVLARELAQIAGFSVVGVNLSSELLRIADGEEAQQPLGINYVQEDARSLSSLGDDSFDGVACSLALTDFDELDPVLGAVRRVLKPGGWLAIATLHPCFEPPHADVIEVAGRYCKQVGNYFEEGRWFPGNPDRLLAKVGWHHRTLATLLNALVDSGFVLDRVAEPRPTHRLEGTALVYGEVAEVLAVRALLSPGLASKIVQDV
jgi:ubiquinone/menaquinone biosynthesis C-methylase UbiE